jgi:hypothetical protein
MQLRPKVFDEPDKIRTVETGRIELVELKGLENRRSLAALVR